MRFPRRSTPWANVSSGAAAKDFRRRSPAAIFRFPQTGKTRATRRSPGKRFRELSLRGFSSARWRADAARSCVQKRHQVRQFNRFPIGQILLLRPGDETVEQRRVGFLRVLRLPAFMPQVLQKIFDQILHGRVLTSAIRRGNDSKRVNPASGSAPASGAVWRALAPNFKCVGQPTIQLHLLAARLLGAGRPRLRPRRARSPEVPDWSDGKWKKRKYRTPNTQR